MRARKSELRARVRASRASRDADARAQASQKLTLELLGLVADRGARRIAAFLPTGTEPPIADFLALAHSQGVEILVPRVVDASTMAWVLYHPDHDQVRSLLGVPEIAETAGLPTEHALPQLDLVLVPAAAVDSHGMRLGWGKGYYDRALSAGVHPPVYAVVFDDELVDEVPTESHDQPVDGVVTPSGTRVF